MLLLWDMIDSATGLSPMSIIPLQENSIVHASGEAITALIDKAESVHESQEGEHHRKTGYTYRNEKERLEIWMNEHEVRFGRLDYKLREASHLRDRILTLLRELSSTRLVCFMLTDLADER